MPVLPGPEDLGGSPSAQSGAGIARIDTTGFGEGIAKAGAGLQSAGNLVSVAGYRQAQEDKEKALQTQDFDAQSRTLQFEQQQRDAFDQATQSAAPGASGFTQGFLTSYDQNARDFFATIPEPVKAKYNVELLRLRSSFGDTAHDFEQKEATRYTGEQIDNGQSTLLGRVSSDPKSWAGAKTAGEDQINAAPTLSSVDKDIAAQAWRKRVSLAVADIDQQSDPAGFQQRLGLGPVDTSDATTLLKRFESFTPSAKWDVNAFRAGYGSDTVTLPDGTFQPVTRNTVVTQADADRDLARRAPEFADTASKQVGAPAWDTLDPPTRAALTSVAYNYGNLPESVVAAVRGGDKEQIAAAVQTLPDNPSRRAVEASVIRGGTNVPAPEYAALSYEDRQKLYDSSREKQTAETTSGVQDQIAYLRSGQPDTGAYQPADLERIYGPEKAALIQKQIDDAKSYGADVNATKLATPDQIQQMVDDRTTQMQSPEDFRSKAQDLKGLLGVIKDRNTAIKNDAATYVVQNDTTVSDAYDKMSQSGNDPTALATASASYAAAALTSQTALGVPADKQRILPAPLATQIISQFKTQPQGGQNAAELMQTLAGQWGKYWPQVFGEMSKDLPPSALVAGTMVRPEQQLAAGRLSEAAAAGTKALEAGVIPDTRKEIKGAIPGLMSDFQSSLPSNARNAGTFQTFSDAVYQLALSYAAEGDSGTRATQRAYQDVLGGSYGFRTNPNNTNAVMRVPVQYDADSVRENATRLLQSIAGGIRIPQSLAGLPPKDTEAAYLSALHSQGYWVTSPDESGLTLYDGTRRAVVTAKGEPERFTWNDILALGKEVAPADALPAYDVMGNPTGF